MSLTSITLILTCASGLAFAPPAEPTSQPQTQPAPQPYAQPQPAQPQPYAQPQPAPQPYAQPQPAPQPYTQPQPVYQDPEPNGVGMLVTGPLLIGVGVPFSFLGNAAWRDNCGPSNTDGECFGGSTASVASHLTTGLGYGLGILFTGLGAKRLGRVHAGMHPGRSTAPFIIPGAILLPSALTAMGLVRLLLWLPTPDCQTYGCVATNQTTSTIAVAALAATASAGSGLLGYGLGYRRGPRRPLTFHPQLGPTYAGFGIAGRF